MNFLSSSKLKENLTELHIIVRTTGYNLAMHCNAKPMQYCHIKKGNNEKKKRCQIHLQYIYFFILTCGSKAISSYFNLDIIILLSIPGHNRYYSSTDPSA